MKSIKFLLKPSRRLVLFAALVTLPISLQAQTASGAGKPAGEAEKPNSTALSPGHVSLSAVRYLGFPAFRLSDGRSEAVVVPALGRVMRYALKGGVNVLWNSLPGETKPGEWRNWGGDKSWPSPQGQWPISIGHDWPPHPSWDGRPYTATVLSGGRLRITSGVWPRFGVRVMREFGFDSNGDFVISQTYEKLSGPPTQLAIWAITQVAAPEAIFVSANPQSAYNNGFHWLTKPQTPPEITRVSPDLLRVRSNGASTNKIGIDAPLSSIVVVKDGLAFQQKAAQPPGNYPDGAQNSGFPVEVFDIGGTGSQHYMETELLSPLRLFYVHSRWTHSIRWSLHTLKNSQVDSPQSAAEVGNLIRSR